MTDPLMVPYFEVASALGRALDHYSPEFWRVVDELDRVLPSFAWHNAMTDSSSQLRHAYRRASVDAMFGELMGDGPGPTRGLAAFWEPVQSAMKIEIFSGTLPDDDEDELGWLDRSRIVATPGCRILVDGIEQALGMEPLLTIQSKLADAPAVWLRGAHVDDVSVFYDDQLVIKIPRYPTFVVESIFEIAGRGPAICRGEEPAEADWHVGVRFVTGGEMYCVGRPDLTATIAGIEYWRGGSAMRQGMQQSLLIRGVDRSDLEVGQTWKMWWIPLLEDQGAP